MSLTESSSEELSSEESDRGDDEMVADFRNWASAPPQWETFAGFFTGWTCIWRSCWSFFLCWLIHNPLWTSRTGWGWCGGDTSITENIFEVWWRHWLQVGFGRQFGNFKLCYLDALVEKLAFIGIHGPERTQQPSILWPRRMTSLRW